MRQENSKINENFASRNPLISVKTKKRQNPNPRLRNWQCGEVYHVYQRGNYKQDVFHTHDQLITYLNRVDILARRYHVRLHAFCLMSNHVHFLVETTRKDGISRFMQQLQSYHARWIHSTQGRDGHLWKNRFGAKQIRSSRHYHKAMIYIERNPVEAHLAKTAAEYPYSSAAAHVANSPVATFGQGPHQATVHLYLDRWRAECDPATWAEALADPSQTASYPDQAHILRVLGPDRHRPLLPNPIPPLTRTAG